MKKNEQRQSFEKLKTRDCLGIWPEAKAHRYSKHHSRTSLKSQQFVQEIFITAMVLLRKLGKMSLKRMQQLEQYRRIWLGFETSSLSRAQVCCSWYGQCWRHPFVFRTEAAASLLGWRSVSFEIGLAIYSCWCSDWNMEKGIRHSHGEAHILRDLSVWEDD